MFREPFPDNPIYLASQSQKSLIKKLSNSRLFADEFDRIREKAADPKLNSDEASGIIDWLVSEEKKRKEERDFYANRLRIILFEAREAIPKKKFKYWLQVADETQTTINRLKQITIIVSEFMEEKLATAPNIQYNE